MSPAATAPVPLDVETAARLRTAIGRLSRQLRITAAAREAGLSPTGISVLLSVVRTGSVRPSDLAAGEGINPTMLSRVLGALVEDGWVERASDPDDRRVAWVAPTPAGRRLAERMRRQRTDAVNTAMTALSERDRGRIEKALPALEALADQLKDVRP